MKHRKMFLRTGRALLALAALGSTALAQRGARGDFGIFRPRIDTTFAFDKTGDLTVTAGAGEVRITGWARPDIRIVAVRQSGGMSMTASSSRVRVDARPQNMSRSRFEISVPIGVRVTVAALSATVDVSGTQGEINITTTRGRVAASDGTGRSQIITTAGTITLQRFAGDTRVTAMTGPLEISEVSGSLTITTITAPATIERADLANLQFDAAQGNLDFSGRLSSQGTHHIETWGGNVELRFPGDFGATINLETLNGKLHTDFPVTMQPRGNDRRGSDDRQQYTINGGGAVVSVSTLNGGLFLRKISASNGR